MKVMDIVFALIQALLQMWKLILRGGQKMMLRQMTKAHAAPYQPDGIHLSFQKTEQPDVPGTEARRVPSLGQVHKTFCKLLLNRRISLF